MFFDRAPWEWAVVPGPCRRAALPTAVQAVATELATAGREVPPRAHELLLRGGTLQPVLGEELFVAMCIDYANITRTGMPVRGLERYSK